MERNLKLLRDWSAKAGDRRDRLFVWNYPCWPAFWTEAPLVFPHNLRQWLQDTHPISSGEFINPGGQDFQRQHFMCWLWHRLLWDRHADVDALLHDYATQFYGPAGKAMEELYRHLADRYEKIPWSHPLGDSYVPPELMYLETYTPEAVAMARRLADEALAACPADPDDLHRRRVLWMREGLDVFFAEADGAHQWLNHAPAYAVGRVKHAPAAADWDAAPKAPLPQGNFGADPRPPDDHAGA